MAPAAVAVPTILVSPGYLFIAPLSSTLPTNTVAGSVFTDAWPAAWLPLGATEDGSEESYSTTVEPISVAEYLDPIQYATTGRAGTIAFALANWSLSNYRRAVNGGTAALTPTSGTGATALYTVNPPTAGSEVRCMIGWESLDNTLRYVAHQTIQGGEVRAAYKKAPAYATIPCTFNLEVPSGGSPGRAGVRAPTVASIDLFGESFELVDDLSDFALMEFSDAMENAENTRAGLAATMHFLREGVAEKDWKRFRDTARKNKASTQDLLPLVVSLFYGQTARPTQRPADSSAGPLDTETSLTGDSSSRVIARLEGQGRPDLALVVSRAQEFLAG